MNELITKHIQKLRVQKECEISLGDIVEILNEKINSKEKEIILHENINFQLFVFALF